MTNWNYNTIETGGDWTYNRSDFTYNIISYDGKSVKYNSVGTLTMWNYQSKN